MTYDSRPSHPSFDAKRLLSTFITTSANPMQTRRFRISLTVFALVLIAQVHSPAQGQRHSIPRQRQAAASKSDTAGSRTAFIHTMDHLRDSLLADQGEFASQLERSLHSNGVGQTRRVEAALDSLLTSVRDTLDPLRSDSLRALERTFWKTLHDQDSLLQRQASLLAQSARAMVESTHRAFLTCDGCTEASDYADRRTEFLDSVESVVSAIRDSAKDAADDWLSILRDTTDSMVDSLASRKDELVDRATDEREWLEEHASRVITEVDYMSQTSFRGRDNGVPQASLSPSLTYIHQTGLFISGQASWLSQATEKWDAWALAGGYKLTLSRIAELTLTYTRMWFSSQSAQSQSDFSSSLEAVLETETQPVAFAVDISDDIGAASEWSIGAAVSHIFEGDETIKGADLRFQPGVLFVAGQQNYQLVAKRVQKSKKGKAAVRTSTKKSSVFGAMDYELFLPLTLQKDAWNFSAGLTYDIPVNVLDASTASPFFSFLAGISVTIR